MGPKKGGVHDKKEAAREREETKKKESKSKAEQEKEDSYWAAAGEGAKSKAQAKKEEEAKKAQETAAKKAEAKRLAELEEAELSKPKGSKNAPVVGVQKMTKYQLDQQRQLEEQIKAQELQAKELAAKREVHHDDYATHLDTHANTNKDDSVLVDARNVTEALASLGVGATPEVDKHPEKRMRSAWLAYEERMLPIMKEEKPGLKMSQYKDMIWKAWQKAPENPINAAAAAAAGKA